MEVVPPGLREEVVVARPTTPSPEPRMGVHENARAAHHSGMLIEQRLGIGWSVAAVAAAQGVTPKTVRKRRDRNAAEGEAGLLDRSSRPHRSPARLDSTAEDAIEALRRQRLSGPAIARKLGQRLHLARCSAAASAAYLPSSLASPPPATSASSLAN